MDAKHTLFSMTETSNFVSWAVFANRQNLYASPFFCGIPQNPIFQMLPPFSNRTFSAAFRFLFKVSACSNRMRASCAYHPGTDVFSIWSSSTQLESPSPPLNSSSHPESVTTWTPSARCVYPSGRSESSKHLFLIISG